MSIRLNDLLIRSNALGDLCILHDSVLRFRNLNLGFVERLALYLPLGLQGSNNVLILPTDLNQINISNLAHGNLQKKLN